MTNPKNHIYRYTQAALWLGYFTIFYNLLEGLVSVFFGARGEALYFGAGRLAELYAVIETRAKANDAAAVVVTLAQVHKEVAAIEAFISEYTVRVA